MPDSALLLKYFSLKQTQDIYSGKVTCPAKSYLSTQLHLNRRLARCLGSAYHLKKIITSSLLLIITTLSSQVKSISSPQFSLLCQVCITPWGFWILLGAWHWSFLPLGWGETGLQFYPLGEISHLSQGNWAFSSFHRLRLFCVIKQLGWLCSHVHIQLFIYLCI